MSFNSREKKLCETANELITKKLRFNLLILLSDICVDITEYQDLSVKGETAVIFEEIKSLVRELYDAIIQTEKSGFFQKISDVRKNVLTTLQSINTCAELCSLMVQFAFDEKAIIDFYNNDDFKNLEFDYEKVMEDCLDFVYNFDDNDDNSNKNYDDLKDFDSKRKQSLILSCLPLKMTKQKYDDFLREFFIYVFGEEDSKPNIIVEFESLKRSFAPFKKEFIGNKFPNISDFLFECTKKDYSNLPCNEIDADIKALLDIGKNIQEISDFINSLYNDINYIINIASFAVDEDYLFQDDLMFKDLYFSVRNIIDSKDNEIFIEETLERIYNDIEVTKTDCDVLYSNFTDILEMINKNNISDETDCYIDTVFNIEKNFFMKAQFDTFLYDDIQNNEIEISEEEFLNKKIDEFIEFTKNALSDIKNKDSKKIKTNFLKNLIYPFGDKEFKDYLKFVFDDLGNDKRDCLVALHIDRVFKIEEFYDFDDTEDESDFEDSFGVHDENCQCHNHSHNHIH